VARKCVREDSKEAVTGTADAGDAVTIILAGISNIDEWCYVPFSSADGPQTTMLLLSEAASMCRYGLMEHQRISE